jgi:hypothetical protein
MVRFNLLLIVSLLSTDMRYCIDERSKHLLTFILIHYVRFYNGSFVHYYVHYFHIQLLSCNTK